MAKKMFYTQCWCCGRRNIPVNMKAKYFTGKLCKRGRRAGYKPPKVCMICERKGYTENDYQPFRKDAFKWQQNEND